MTSTPRSDEPAASPAIDIDLRSPIPAYEQIRSQITGLIATSKLRSGDQLPSIRQLAADLKIAGGTVLRAYRELDRAGLVEGDGRRGTRVRQSLPRAVVDKTRQQRLLSAASEFARRAGDLGLGEDAVLAAVRAAMSQIEPRQT